MPCTIEIFGQKNFTGGLLYSYLKCFLIRLIKVKFSDRDLLLVEVFPSKWSAVTVVSFLGFGGCRFTGRWALFLRVWGLECGGIVVMGPRSLGSNRSVLSAISGRWGSGIWSGGGGEHRFFGLVPVVFEHTLVA